MIVLSKLRDNNTEYILSAGTLIILVFVNTVGVCSRRNHLDILVWRVFGHATVPGKYHHVAVVKRLINLKYTFNLSV